MNFIDAIILALVAVVLFFAVKSLLKKDSACKHCSNRKSCKNKKSGKCE